MNSIQYQELDFNFLYKIEGFRYLSNINGLSLLDGTYLERLITTRLSEVGALLYKKIGKHHEENYIITIDPVYIQFFFLGR